MIFINLQLSPDCGSKWPHFLLDSERSDECIDYTMMYLVLWGVKSKNFPIVFKSVRKNPKKVTEKREFLRKTSIRPNRFFYMVVNQKLITLNFQKNLTFFES
ncbi:Uncharacterized protein FWK35_00006155 [Aphis craccivora]|uniref:Uncharacterized protein n=1 Tax=Aphis craccivora TaxID=307492 RepID=A0A6G0Z439_APHCR|nr:Uncharacterized protein FWK35_00006155 [Aphis craccivora]